MGAVKKLLFALGVLTLCAAVGLQAYTVFTGSGEKTKDVLLAEALPRSHSGWEIEDHPVDDDPDMRETIQNILKYDDSLFRSYTNGNHLFTVYIAYWEPGKLPPRMVGNHSPDTCWIKNGWSCEPVNREHAVPQKSDNGQMLPAEWGIYERDDAVQHVLFWHVVGDDITSYDQKMTHDRLAIVKDLKKFGLDQKKEQYFVRLASSRHMSELRSEPVFGEVMNALHDLCLAADHGAED